MNKPILLLLPAWVVCTFVASLAGGEYVRATLDCLTPATLTQAFGVALYLLKRPQNAPATSPQAWGQGVFVLGVLQLLSILLTLGSFGISSVSHTYMLRTLEPVFALVLMWIVHNRRSSFRELALVCSVVFSIGCVLHKPTSTTAALESAGGWRERHTPTILALVAALSVSSRSVASKTLAASTGQHEVELFLASCVPALVLSVLCQFLLWVAFGLMPTVRGNMAPAAAVVTLLLSGFFQCCYSTISFQVLQLYSPIMHAVLNVMKRLVVVVVSAALFRTQLTALQLVGLAAANACTVMLALAKPSQQNDVPADACTVPQSAAAPLLSKSRTPVAEESCRHGHAPPRSLQYMASSQALSRLAWLSAVVITTCVVCLAAVLAALSQAGNAAVTPAAVFSNASSHNNSAQHGSSGSSSMAAPVWTANQFITRDARRIQCLQGLHNASKASLEPFFKHAKGGVALFDVALHPNLGDGLLWAAAARLVTQFHQSTKVVCALAQFDDKESRRNFPACSVNKTMQVVGSGGVILLQPGGNWGSLWAEVQKKRVKYLGEMAKHWTRGARFKVVQLPQTVDVDDQALMARLDEHIRALPEGMLSFFGRSADSCDYAQQHYPNVATQPAPDIAWSLGPMMADAPQVDVLFLMRQDMEAAGSETAVAQDMRNPSLRGERRKQYAPLLDDAGITYDVRDWDFTRLMGLNYAKEASQVALTQLADSRLEAAREIMSRGKVVVTNRLHAAIVANLLGRPLIWINTTRKKISSVRSLAFSFAPEVCTETNMHSKQVGSMQEAVEVAAAWLSSPAFAWCTEAALLHAQPAFPIVSSQL